MLKILYVMLRRLSFIVEAVLNYWLFASIASSDFYSEIQLREQT